MNKKKSKIVFTGGSGRFGNVLQKINSNYKILFPSKITSPESNSSNLLTQRSSELFPEPLGPHMTTQVFCIKSIEISFSARKSPYRNDKFFI